MNEFVQRLDVASTAQSATSAIDITYLRQITSKRTSVYFGDRTYIHTSLKLSNPPLPLGQKKKKEWKKETLTLLGTNPTPGVHSSA